MPPKYTVRVCRGPSCGDERNSSHLADEFRRQLAERGLAEIEEVEMCWQSCFGRCSKGPNVLVRKVGKKARPRRTFALATPLPSSGGPATMYNYVTPADVADIVTEHLEAGRPVRRLIERARRLEEASLDGSPTEGQRAKSALGADRDGDR